MVSEFSTLRDDEIEVLLNAPVLVALLIAGADGEIDKKEISQALDLAQGKQSRERAQLIAYYKEVGIGFETKFFKLVELLPTDVDGRNSAISMELRKLNHILPKIDHKFAVKLVASLKDMAKKVAGASGGLLGYMSVSYEEKKLMELDMIKDPGNHH
ncbi:MAG: hypothetical protein NWS46_05980 [Cyclobacteriaceae bacterium]|jgi:hypothetical protein|nr:hypothetical protein [Cyclobacteriaceae bacterium]